jgi:hypothetical protein
MRAPADSSTVAGSRVRNCELTWETSHVWFLSELDPLTLVPYLDATHVVHDVTDDPMLEEFAATPWNLPTTPVVASAVAGTH